MGRNADSRLRSDTKAGQARRKKKRKAQANKEGEKSCMQQGKKTCVFLLAVGALGGVWFRRCAGSPEASDVLNCCWN